MWQCRRALVLAPHTDDAELGAGGLISRLVEDGAEVRSLVFSDAAASLPSAFAPHTLREEAVRAAAALGIASGQVTILDFEVRHLPARRQDVLEALVRVRTEYRPDLVILPSGDDIHQDHSTVHQEGVRAFKGTTLLGYELVWNMLSNHCQAFVSLEDRHVVAKEKALAEYASQSSRSYMQPGFVRSLAHVRGLAAGVDLAEGYEVIRWMW